MAGVVLAGAAGHARGAHLAAGTGRHGRVDPHRPPLLFVPGYGHGAWAFAEQWLEHAAERGYPAYAMSLRGHGDSGAAPGTTLRAYAHDVVQVAARLPRQAVLIGHGVGGLAVAQALARYPARAGVLLAPVFGGLAYGLVRRCARNPAGTLPARLRAAGAAAPAGSSSAASCRSRRPGRTPIASSATRSHRGCCGSCCAGDTPEPPVGDAPVLVVGSPDDKVVPRRSLERIARRYGGAPLLFPGMGHDLMLDARWQEPIDAILDWLEKSR